MHYNEDLARKIAMQYALAKVSIEKMRNLKSQEDFTESLGYLFPYFEEAEKAIKFLNSVSSALIEKAKISELELELAEFNNAKVKL